jgi:hypothetical protein
MATERILLIEPSVGRTTHTTSGNQSELRNVSAIFYPWNPFHNFTSCFPKIHFAIENSSHLGYNAVQKTVKAKGRFGGTHSLLIHGRKFKKANNKNEAEFSLALAGVLLPCLDFSNLQTEVVCFC